MSGCGSEKSLSTIGFWFRHKSLSGGLTDHLRGQFETSRVSASDGRHFNDLSFNQFDARVRGEYAGFAHALVFTDSEVVFGGIESHLDFI